MKVIKAALPRVARPLPKPNLGPGMKKPGMMNHLLRVARPLPPPAAPQSTAMSYGGAQEQVLFSILICSLHNRKEKLNRLLEVLIPQMTKDTEVLVDVDSGEITIGQKRNNLLNRSKGQYVAFVDDDDLVVEDYIAKVLKALETKPDCVGMEGLLYQDNTTKKFIHSLKYKEWFEKGGIYYRNPNHLNPIKKELALKVGFTSKNHGEDADFSKAVLPFLATEVYLEGPVYKYYP